MPVIPEQSKRCHQRLDALTVAEVEDNFAPIIFLAIMLLLDIVENVLNIVSLGNTRTLNDEQ